MTTAFDSRCLPNLGRSRLIQELSDWCYKRFGCTLSLVLGVCDAHKHGAGEVAIELEYQLSQDTVEKILSAPAREIALIRALTRKA